MSYFVARRTSEIGMRMALGATGTTVVAMVMRSALTQVLIGLVLGIPAALLTNYLMAVQSKDALGQPNSLLYQVNGHDPLALVGATPGAWRVRRLGRIHSGATRRSIEPMQALRTE